MLSVIMMSGILLDVVMLGVAGCRNTEWHYAGCGYAKCS